MKVFKKLHEGLVLLFIALLGAVIMYGAFVASGDISPNVIDPSPKVLQAEQEAAVAAADEARAQYYRGLYDVCVYVISPGQVSRCNEAIYQSSLGPDEVFNNPSPGFVWPPKEVLQ
jgi:hypothetical protein